MLLILLLVIKTINASTLPSSALNDLAHVKSNKCEQITITQHCPELKYNQTMVSNFAHGHHLDIDDANEMVSWFYSPSLVLIHFASLAERSNEDVEGDSSILSPHVIAQNGGLLDISTRSRWDSLAFCPHRNIYSGLPVNTLDGGNNQSKTDKEFVNDSAWRMETEEKEKKKCNA